MRLRIETTGVEFRTAGAARPKKDWQNKELQARTPDGRPIWSVRLLAFDSGAGASGSMEQIWVEIAGDEPQLVPNEVVAVANLTYTPWASIKVIGGKQKAEIMRAFRADSITMAGAPARRAANVS